MRFHSKTFAFFLCLLLLSACDDGSPASKKADDSGSGGERPLPEAGYIEVQPRRLALTYQLPGRVKAYRVAEIRPQVSGIIQSRLFKEGSFVEPGQQLYQIDPARYEANYQVARANLQKARAEVKNTSALAERYQRLLKDRAVSTQEYEDAVTAVDQAKAAVELAKAELRSARINLDYTKVYAPISGYIGPSSVTQGALVTASQENALATIRQLDPVYVDLSQAVTEAQQLQKHLAAERVGGDAQANYKVFLLLGNTSRTYPHEGILDAADLAVDENTGMIRLRCVFPNPNTALLPGMFVRAALKLWDVSKAITVPQKSVVIESNGRTIVWIVDENGKAQKRDIRTGEPYRNNWVVLDGLQAGDRVIVEGTMALSQDAAVRPIELEASEVIGVQDVPSDTLDDRESPPKGPLEKPAEPDSGPNPEEHSPQGTTPGTESDAA